MLTHQLYVLIESYTRQTNYEGMIGSNLKMVQSKIQISNTPATDFHSDITFSIVMTDINIVNCCYDKMYKPYQICVFRCCFKAKHIITLTHTVTGYF